jgi:hypothetical protein
MHRTYRRLLSALVGLLAVAGTAAAQTPAPRSLPPLPPLPAIPLAPEVTPAAARADVRPTSGGYVSDIAPPETVGRARVAMTNLQAPIQYGQFGPGCANGCGSCKSTTGFIFGSCQSFFDPCGPIPAQGPRCGKAKFGCAPCGIHPFGQPYGKPYNGCVYDSYLNH